MKIDGRCCFIVAFGQDQNQRKFWKNVSCGGTLGVKKCNYDLERLEDALAKRTVPAQCLKITQNVAFEFFNFGIFHPFLTF